MANLSIKLRLVKAGDKSGYRIKFKGGVDLIINGQRINSDRKGDNTGELDADETRSFPGVSEGSLAAKPLKYLLDKSQMQLSIGYDLAAGHLTLTCEGLDAAKLPPAWKSQEIF